MSSHTNAVKQAALAIVSRIPGSRVFPVPPMTKKAALRDWQHQATDDAANIESWFSDESLNIGLVPGDLVGVFDIEGPNKGLDKGPPGHIALATMEDKFGKLPPTLTARTPSGGEHRFFRVPHEMEMQPQAAGFVNVEFRTGNRLYVLVAPSRTDVGGYEWVDYDAPIVDLPSDWVDGLDAYKPPTRTGSTSPLTKLDAILHAQRERRFSKQKPPQLESILQGCAWLRDMVDNPAGQTEPDWYAALSVIGLCEDGETLAHECSRGYPGYDHGETAAKLEQALKASGPRTCASIASAHCKNCIFVHHREGWSPLALGFHHPGMVEVLSEVLYSKRDELFITIGDRASWRPSAFAASVQHKIKNKPREQLLMSSSLVRVEKLDYIAGDDRLVVERVGNRWMRDGAQAKNGEWSVIREFTNYLLPVDKEREHILDYFAHLLRQPNVKIEHGIMLTGAQGNGKSTLAYIFGRLFGRNARKVGGTELSGRFKSRLVDCQLLHIEEAHHGGRYEIYEELKELLTAETFSVEAKGIDTWDGRTPRGILMLTNHDSGVVIPNGDRRWLIASTASEARSGAYFTKLHDALADDDTIAALVFYLRHQRDISKFRPKAPPPMTLAKQEAGEATATPIAQALRHLIDSESAAWSMRTFVTVEQVADSLATSRFDIGRPTPNKIGNALKEIGAVRIRRIRYRGKPLRLWALRDGLTWATASEDEIRAQYERDLSSSVVGENVYSIAPSLGDLTKLALRAASGGAGDRTNSADVAVPAPADVPPFRHS